MSESTGNPFPRESDNGLSRQPVRRLVLPVMLGSGVSVTPVVSALRQDYTAGLIAGAPTLGLALMTFFLIICPAVWSRDPNRQAAALAVLDRLLGKPAERPKQRRRRVTEGS